jgi:hypothetical protein
MADFDFGRAASGAASGAAAGSSFGPWGTVIGGTTGFLSGFLGSDGEPSGESPARERALDENRERLRVLTDDLEAARERSPTDTSFFDVGAAELQARTERQAEADAEQAAARGLTGSQFELAQDANRAQAQGEGLRSLLRSAEQVDRQEEARLFEAQQRQRENLNALLSGQAQSFDRQQRRQQRAEGRALQSTMQNLPFLLSHFGGGGGGEGNATDAFVDPVGSARRGRYA